MTRPRGAAAIAAATTAAAALAALATGCGAHGDPSASAFRQGTCRKAAPAVLSAGRAARDAVAHGAAVADVVALTRAQHRLESVRGHASAADRQQLDRLVTAIGLYRLHAVGHTVSRTVSEAVVSAQHEVVTRCVAGG